MSDPKRLLEMGADDFELEVLKSALPDRGSAGAYERTLTAIAAGTAITVATAATSAATPVGASVVLKWLGVGALLGFATAGSVSVALDRASPATPPASMHVEAPAPKLAEARRPNAVVPIPTVTSSRENPTPRPLIDDPATEPVVASGPSVGALPAPVTSSEKLLREVKTLDRARSALSSGNASVALAALDEHDREFPAGALGPEATVLRARALVLSGNRSAALGIARSVVRANPQSAHAKALRNLLPELGANP